MKYSNNWLIESNKNNEVQYIFFWGNQPSQDGSITKSCLSQWWPAPFETDGICYKTAEHWMMAEKAKLFNDLHTRSRIIEANEPDEVKSLGRTIKGFDNATWDKHKYEIVVAGNFYKFAQNKDLQKFLLSTGQSILVEASPVDKVWGIGMAADNKDINNPGKWHGENLLGYALMEVRDMFKITR